MPSRLFAFVPSSLRRFVASSLPLHPPSASSCLLLFLLLLTSLSSAQTRSDDTLRAYLITMGPGEQLFERFSHNAIWIHDPTVRPELQDVAFNYGIFDFGGDFYWRFVRGDMRYWMAGFDAPRTLQQYREDDRTIWVQELNLSQRQILSLRDFLWWNQEKANRYYPYNYYRDNCSTRVRDALDAATGGQIRRQSQDVLAGHTYRWHTRRIVRENIWVYTALEFVLGHRVDRPISQWDEMFLPECMRQSLQAMTIMNDQGDRVPLVKSTQHVYQAKRPDVSEAPPAWGKWYLLLGLGIGSVMMLLARTAGKWPRRLLACLILAWAFLTGGAGWFLVSATGLTNHWSVYDNENLLHFSPLAIGLLFYAVGALRGRPTQLRRARTVAWLVLGSSLIGVALKASPAFYQSNWPMIAWVLPVHVSLAIIFAGLVKPQAKPDESAGHETDRSGGRKSHEHKGQ